MRTKIGEGHPCFSDGHEWAVVGDWAVCIKCHMETEYHELSQAEKDQADEDSLFGVEEP